MPPERKMTEAEMRRKTNKPIMEKKRRERINKCLEDLKSIVLTSVSEDSRPNKLEKADILEMTVRYLKTIQSGKAITPAVLSESNEHENTEANTSPVTSPPSQSQVRQKGYAQCVHEVTSFLSKTEGISVDFRTKLLGHLADKFSPVPGVKPPKKRQRLSCPLTQDNLRQGFISELDIRQQSRNQSFQLKSGTPAPKPLNHTVNFPPHSFQIPTNNGQFGSYPAGPGSIGAGGCRGFSPIPVSPISNASLPSPIASRRSPSPSLSAASHRSDDSTGEAVDSTDFSHLTNSLCCSPAVDPASSQLHRFLEAHHHHHQQQQLNYTSSDSGNWSSGGSSPPSPIEQASQSRRFRKSLPISNELAKPTVKVECPSSSQGGMWRPWGL